jgi:hypothetical protein
MNPLMLPDVRESSFFLRKNSASVMMTARKRRAPMTVPAIAAIETPWGGGGDDPEVEVELDDVDVGEGAPGVEDGDRLFRQLLSSDRPTTLISEVPP